MNARPRLRQGGGNPPPYELNQFPAGFARALGRRLIYELHVSLVPKIEGGLWEKIFADCIGAQWVNSNSKLEDVRLKNCAWSGKAVFGVPEDAPSVPLITGRNDIQYSFEVTVAPGDDPAPIGKMVLDIWNGRVAGVRDNNEHLRTVVLIKSPPFYTKKKVKIWKEHLSFAVFEKNTKLYNPDEFRWEWNDKNNLEGYSVLDNDRHCFTWQIGGQQFTIHEPVPMDRLCFRIKVPPKMNMDSALKALGEDASWVEEFAPSAPRVPKKRVRRPRPATTASLPLSESDDTELADALNADGDAAAG